MENEEQTSPKNTAPPTPPSSPLDGAREEITILIREVKDHLCSDGLDKIIEHGTQALTTIDALYPILANDDADIIEILNDTKEDLLNCYVSYACGRMKMAFLCLRGAMEGLITALYYRQQKISLNLWSSGVVFHMAHELIDNKHEFYKYYINLLSDEAFSRQYPNVSPKAVFTEMEALYKDLSSFIHKKSPITKSKLPTNCLDSVERVFRVILCLVEREEDLPQQLMFPQPATYAQLVVDKQQFEAQEKKKRYAEAQEQKANQGKK